MKIRGWMAITAMMAMLWLEALPLSALPANVFVSGTGMRVTLSRQHPGYAAIRNTLRAYDHAVLKLLRKHPGENIVDLYVEFSTRREASPTVELRGRRTTLILPDDYQERLTDFSLQRSVLAAIYLTKCGYSLRHVSELDKVPYWLLAGTYEYIRRYQAFESDIMELNSYPEFHALAVAGGEIIPDDLVTGRIYPDDGDVFLIYSAAAEFLLVSCFNASDEPVVEQLIRMEVAKPHRDVENFYSVAGGALMQKLPLSERHGAATPDREKIRKWFWNVLRLKSVSYFYPWPVERLNHDFLELYGACEYRKKNPDGTVTEDSCPLRELWQRWDEIDNRGAVVLEIRQRLSPMVQACSGDFINILLQLDRLLARLPLSDEAYKKFKHDHDDFDFARDADRIKAEFAATVDRYREIEVWLDRAEKQYLSPEERFYYELRALRQHERTERALWPEANKMLDRLEKEYFTE